MKTLTGLVAFTFILLMNPQQASAADRLFADSASKKYRTGKIDPRVAAVPPALQKNVFTDPQTFLPKLTAFLTKGAQNDYIKAKRIHDWITDKFAYDMDLFYGLSSTGSRQTYGFFKYRRTTCGGFARLFKEMARLGGMKAEYVPGYAKTYFNKRRNIPGNHAWNIIYINNKGYIVDCSADKRQVYKNRRYEEKQDYRDRQLFINPAAKILKNFPRDTAYRLTTGINSVEEFLSSPNFQYAYFEYGISFVTPLEKLITKEKKDRPGGRLQSLLDVLHLNTGTAQISLRCPEKVLIKTYLKDSLGKKYYFNTFSYQSGDQRVCLFSPPAPGEYTAWIRAKDSSEEGNFRTVFKFTIKAKKAGQLLPAKGNVIYKRQQASLHNLTINSSSMDGTRGRYMLDLSWPESVSVTSNLYDENYQKIKGAVTTSYYRNRKKYYYTIPDSRTCYIIVSSKRKSGASRSHSSAVFIKASKTVTASRPDFPPSGDLMLSRRFSEEGFTLIQKPVLRKGIYSVTIRAPRGYTLDSRMRSSSRQRLDDYRACDAGGRDYTFYFSSPGGVQNYAAIYRIDTDNKWKSIAWFYIHDIKGPELPLPGKLFLNRYFKKTRCRLISESLDSPAGEIYRVEIECPSGYTMASNLKDEAGIKQRGHYRQSNKGNRYTFTFTAPGKGRYRGKIYAIDAAKKWTSIGEFIIRGHKKGKNLR